MKKKMIYGLLMALSMSAFAAMPLMAESVNVEAKQVRPIIRFSPYQTADIIDATKPKVEKLFVFISAPLDYTVDYYVDDVYIGEGVTDIEKGVNTIDWLIDDTTTNPNGTKVYTIKAIARDKTGDSVQVATTTSRLVKLRVETAKQDKIVEVDKAIDYAAGNNINMKLKLTNVGEAIDLSKLEVGYYFTEPEADEQKLWCDYAGISLEEAPWYIGLSNAVTEVSDKGEGVYYAALKFDDEASLEKNAVLDIQARIAKADWSDYEGTETGNVVVYYDGKLIYGEEAVN